MWTLGVGSDRSLGRPKEWNGEPSGFDDFAFKFSNWLSGLPGDAERFLEESVTMAQPIQWATLTQREKVVARGVATALRALIGGKALTCIRHHPEKPNGFEMWRLLYRAYKPDTATRKVGLLERVMDDQPAPGMDFGDWFLRWLDLVGECEKARGRMIDDDIKVAVMLKRPPKELRDHLVLESPQLANVEFKFPVMRELIHHWCQSRRVFFPQKPPMEVAAVSTAARDSDVTVSAVGWHGSWHEKGHGKGKSRESDHPPSFAPLDEVAAAQEGYQWMTPPCNSSRLPSILHAPPPSRLVTVLLRRFLCVRLAMCNCTSLLLRKNSENW